MAQRKQLSQDYKHKLDLNNDVDSYVVVQINQLIGLNLNTTFNHKNVSGKRNLIVLRFKPINSFNNWICFSYSADPL